MNRGTLKTTVVLVATHDKTEVFRSVAAVPAGLRKRMLTTASRGNSATILIADKRGREELARAVQGLPSVVKLRDSKRLRAQLVRNAIRHADWLDILLLGVAGTLIWAAAILR